MVPLIAVLMFLALLAVDVVVRMGARRFHEQRERREREEVLRTAVRLDFDEEAKSLKRVEVPHPKARILAVDDEGVVLDSFRRILVLDGYNVDTVENGREALGLVRRNDYDFVFTDLKMPEMDGVEVVKAVKHLRPDVDVVVITGYASIETAVDTLKHGACEYVQKPFTAEELSDNVKRLVIKREARLESQRKPPVRVVKPSEAEYIGVSEYCVPGGAFISAGHVWARLEPDGSVRLGIDDFTRKALGEVEAVLLPQPGTTVKVGDPLFTLKRGNDKVTLQAPLGGRVSAVNEQVGKYPDLVTKSPYESGWVCTLYPSSLASELPFLRIGVTVLDWYQDEVMRLRKVQEEPAGSTWGAIEKNFLDAKVLVHG